MADSIDFTDKPLTPGLNMGTRGNNKIEYLAIHYAASSNSKPGTSSTLDNIDSWRRGSASADFSVDDGTFTKYNPDPQQYFCFSVGDSLYSNTKGGTFHGKCTNRNSISIEICSSAKPGAGLKHGNHAGWYFTQEALSNAVKLARYLMQTYNIPLSNVIRHWDVSGKPCPGIPGWNLDPLINENDYSSLGKDNDESQWLAFKQAIQNGGDVVATSSSSNSNDNSTTPAAPSSGPTNSCGGAPAVNSLAAVDTPSSGAFDSSAEANATSTDSGTTNSSQFVDLASYGLKCDARYATTNNFTGAVVPGYKKATCWGKKDLAEALKKVNEDLKKQGMELVIFDAYRPKAALDAFIAWKGKNRCTASDIMYQPFGCTVKPDFKGLISDKSTHNYGLSVDLTIKNNSSATHPKGLWEGSTIMNTKLDEFMIKRDSKSKQSSSGYWYECSIPIDGKTNYDFKNPQHRFLRSIMEKYKFQGIPSEWWHFQLNGAKYCNTNTEMIQ